MDGHDSAAAGLLGEVVELREAGALGLEADELETGDAGLGCGGGADDHAEALYRSRCKLY